MARARHQHDRPPTVTGEQARQGRIVLDTRRRRIVFFGGLAAVVLLPLIAALLWQ
jgi:hypothetical protein